jgi:hypothetical protein
LQDGIDAAYFRNQARPSQTNALLKNRYKKEDDGAESGNTQVRLFIFYFRSPWIRSCLPHV